ncbi:MAG: TatD family hydrolase, partial [Mycoplasmataceae bacterium]|nr:TatD family hydrolase [Mycoplasmataceae bacterium]
EVEKGCTDFLKEVDFKKVSAIGEIGLDLYRDTNPPIELQKEAFIFQLEIARKNKLPVLVHMRSAEKETYEILSMYKDLTIIMHSFSASKEWANKFVKLGAYISLSGIVTFKSAKELKEIAKEIPLNRILIETDTPYLTPAPNRGKQNQPANVKHTGDYVASIREEEDKVVLETIFNNSLKIFGDI